MSGFPTTPKPRRSDPSRRVKSDFLLSVVVPLYNEAESLEELHGEISTACRKAGIRFEAIYVDDGSTDGSFEVLERLHRSDPRAKAVQFRRNCGKSEALAAGFQAANGNAVVTLDADLQDDPSEIPRLLDKLDEGFDLVSGWKQSRRDPLFSKRLPSKFFNRTTSLLTGLKLHDFNCGIKAYRREAAKTVQVYGELHRYIPALAKWHGFRVTEIPVHHRPRKFGKTKFGVSRYLYGMLDLINVMFIGKFTRRPLHLFGTIGFLFATAGGLVTLYLIVLRIFRQAFLSRRPLFFIGIVFLILGIQFVSIGLLGEMITRSSASEHRFSIRRSLGV